MRVGGPSEEDSYGASLFAQLLTATAIAALADLLSGQLWATCPN
jgi:hypothetical protein